MATRTIASARWRDVAETLSPRAAAAEDGLPPLLIVLTIVTVAVDALAYLRLGHVFVANMIGKVVFLGFAAAGAGGLSVPGIADRTRVLPSRSSLPRSPHSRSPLRYSHSSLRRPGSAARQRSARVRHRHLDELGSLEQGAVLAPWTLRGKSAIVARQVAVGQGDEKRPTSFVAAPPGFGRREPPCGR